MLILQEKYWLLTRGFSEKRKKRKQILTLGSNFQFLGKLARYIRRLLLGQKKRV
jgi:hypothetical protein